MKRMNHILRSLSLLSVLAAALAVSCNKTSTEETNAALKRQLDAWRAIHYPDAVEKDGIYIIDETPGTGLEWRDNLPVTFATYTIRSLNGTVTDNTDEQWAKQLGTWDQTYYYGPQILLTGEDLRDPERHQNFSNTLYRLLELRTLPVINENDTVSTAEIGVGDNDTLGALVAVSVKADLLIVPWPVMDSFTTLNTGLPPSLTTAPPFSESGTIEYPLPGFNFGLSPPEVSSFIVSMISRPAMTLASPLDLDSTRNHFDP